MIKKANLRSDVLYLLACSVVSMALILAACSSAESKSDTVRPLTFQGEPFFPISTFGWPREDPDWKEAGGNTAFKHVSLKSLQDADVNRMQEDLKSYLEKCASSGLACIIYPTRVNGSKLHRAAYDRDFREKSKRFLNAVLDVTAEHPAVLGYWTLDEPENHLWEEWKKRQDPDPSSEQMGDAFADWAVEEMSWYTALIHDRDQNAYVMATVAWWNMYDRLAPLVDVLVPNQYPTHKGDDPLTGPLYDLTYDAAKAAEAVRETDVSSFIYMPGTFDKIGGRWRAPTLKEMRYLWFAPLTQHALGFLAWRITRTSPEYRQDVLYPVMSDVSRFEEWWLAAPLDDRVRSDGDVASVDYLKRFPELVRTVAGETFERKRVQGLPDVSYTLRRIDGDQYLLLMVNNRKEPTSVTVRINNLKPGVIEATEAIHEDRSLIRNGRLKVEMPTFGVHVYRFQDTTQSD